LPARGALPGRRFSGSGFFLALTAGHLGGLARGGEQVGGFGGLLVFGVRGTRFDAASRLRRQDFGAFFGFLFFFGLFRFFRFFFLGGLLFLSGLFFLGGFFLLGS